MKVAASLALVTTFAAFALACEAPSTTSTFVVLEDDYPAASGLVIYRAFWQAVSFETPIAPDSSSDPQNTVPASGDPAYVVLAPGWDPASTTPPTTFIVLESTQEYGVHVRNTVHIPVSDASFAGNCAAGSLLAQAQADFITQTVFPDIFAGSRYDAATCTTTPTGDAGAD